MLNSNENGETPYNLKVQEIEELMRTHETALLRYATRLVNDPNTAQDVVQDTFIKLFKVWDNGSRPTQQVKSWLYRVTHNCAVDYIRKESRLRVLHDAQAEEVAPDTPARQSRTLEEREKMDMVLEHVKKLSDNEQQVLILRLQEGLSYKEISEATDHSEGHVGYILHHAVKKLAKSLRSAGIAEGLAS